MRLHLPVPVCCPKHSKQSKMPEYSVKLEMGNRYTSCTYPSGQVAISLYVSLYFFSIFYFGNYAACLCASIFYADMFLLAGDDMSPERGDAAAEFNQPFSDEESVPIEVEAPEGARGALISTAPPSTKTRSHTSLTYLVHF